MAYFGALGDIVGVGNLANGDITQHGLNGPCTDLIRRIPSLVSLIHTETRLSIPFYVKVIWLQIL